MQFDAFLRAHGFMNVERPAQLWAADTNDFNFIPLLGEMVVVAQTRGVERSQLTLSISNAVVTAEGSADAAGAVRPAPFLEPGEYVVVTVRGPTGFGKDSTWHPKRPRSGLLARLHRRLLSARACYAYIRTTPRESSVTILLRRLR
jgi:hypothetical protein